MQDERLSNDRHGNVCASCPREKLRGIENEHKKRIFCAGLANDTAAVEAWRSDFARIIRARFLYTRSSQTAFAKKLGIKQSIVSRIMNGKLGGLSIEFLLRLCVRLETRGCAAWGPSSDEAYVTDEALARVSTYNLVVTSPYAAEWEPVNAPVKLNNRIAGGSRASKAH